MLVAEGDDPLCYLHGIEGTVFPKDLELASLAHADNGLVITKACQVTRHDHRQFFKTLSLGAASPGDEIGRN